MVWVWRACLGLLIAAYAGWLIWPLVETLAAGGDVAGALTALTRETSRLGGLLPSLWLGSAALYLIAAVLTAARVGAAPGAYFLAFGAEVIQRVLLQSAPEAILCWIARRNPRAGAERPARSFTLAGGSSSLAPAISARFAAMMRSRTFKA